MLSTLSTPLVTTRPAFTAATHLLVRARGREALWCLVLLQRSVVADRCDTAVAAAPS